MTTSTVSYPHEIDLTQEQYEIAFEFCEEQSVPDAEFTEEAFKDEAGRLCHGFATVDTEAAHRTVLTILVIVGKCEVRSERRKLDEAISAAKVVESGVLEETATDAA